MARQKRRWSDNDRHFGPFTWCFGDYWRIGLVVDSGGDKEERGGGCHARLSLGTFTFITELPNWLPDFRIKHIASSWDAATVARLGRNYYFEVFPREYGFEFTDCRTLHTYYGPQTHDSLTTKGRVFFMPWSWRFACKRWFGLNGELLHTGGNDYKRDSEFDDATPKASFDFIDYDGKPLRAATMIEEREWHFGKRWLRWLSFFVKPKVVRSLDIRFSDEVGPEKGSWKGGAVGHAIDMLPGELHEAAFRRYCEQEHRSKYRNFAITFVGPSP